MESLVTFQVLALRQLRPCLAAGSWESLAQGLLGSNTPHQSPQSKRPSRCLGTAFSLHRCRLQAELHFAKDSMKQEGKGQSSVDVLPLSPSHVLLVRGLASGQHSLPKTLSHGQATLCPFWVSPGPGINDME